MKRPAPAPAATSLAAFDLEAFLPYRLAVAADAVSKGLAAVYAERYGLTIPEWRVLANLGRFGYLMAGEAAERSSLDKVQLTRAIQRLAARRLIARATVAADRRRVRLSLTAAGTQLLADIAPLALAWERDLLAALPPAARNALAGALEAIAARATALAAAPANT